MNVLVLCDDYWHPASTVRAGLAPLSMAGFAFDFVEDAAEWSPERMASYPVVLFTKSNNRTQADDSAWMTPAVEQAFLDYVENGGGLLVIHSGTASYQEMPVLFPLLGGTFRHHPKQCPVTIKLAGGDPLTDDVELFTLMDEHYFLKMGDVPVEHFLTAVSEHGKQPAGWRHTVGNGRVCVMTPGHNVDVWLHSNYQTLLNNGLHWCAQKPTT